MEITGAQRGKGEQRMTRKPKGQEIWRQQNSNNDNKMTMKMMKRNDKSPEGIEYKKKKNNNNNKR